MNHADTSPRNSAAYAHIPGWGADLERANRPAYPMERTPPRLPHAPLAEPAAQAASVEVLHSIERPGLTPVYGTTLPPSGVNGSLRRLAFRFSENDLRHWLILLAADRLQVGEALLADLASGHLPNIYKEMGGPAEMKYNPGGAARKALVVGAGVLLLMALSRRRGRRGRR
ncbi:MAG: hypothetical protein JWQ73_4156 [Variovorax sp.]|jgi:hypothetical protein|nr:hypothetical protein [Variovorax sp.]